MRRKQWHVEGKKGGTGTGTAIGTNSFGGISFLAVSA
jgi:hypothetical protein